MIERAAEAGRKFEELVQIMARLRAPDGCPWDQKQTFATLKTYLLEEAYEVMDAIDLQDWSGLAEELGDLLLQPVFLAQIGRDNGFFDIVDALTAINAKLVRRHPHIFGEASAKTAEDVKQRWEEIKKQERSMKGVPEHASRLDGVLRSFPALIEAEKISEKAAAAGFEWPNIEGVLEKMQEESRELAQARESGHPQSIEHEIGDLLFTVVNLARFLKVDPEQALRKTNGRFRARFAFLERETAANGEALESVSLERMEELWQEAKRLEANGHR